MPRTTKKDANLQPGKPLKPNNLSERAAKEWDRLIGELEGAGIQVSTAHRPTLALASTIAADIAKAWETLKVDGDYIHSKGGLVAHPASKRLDALRRDYIKVLTMLGIRTAVPEAPKGEKTLEEMLSE